VTVVEVIVQETSHSHQDHPRPVSESATNHSVSNSLSDARTIPMKPHAHLLSYNAYLCVTIICVRLLTVTLKKKVFVLHQLMMEANCLLMNSQVYIDRHTDRQTCTDTQTGVLSHLCGLEAEMWHQPHNSWTHLIVVFMASASYSLISSPCQVLS